MYFYIQLRCPPHNANAKSINVSVECIKVEPARYKCAQIVD